MKNPMRQSRRPGDRPGGRLSRPGGWVFTEMLVALTIFVLLLTGLGVTQSGVAAYQRFMLVRQHCLAAAQAQLDCIAATGKPMGQEPFQKTWPGLKAVIDQTPGQGDWQGLKLLKVSVTGRSEGHPVRVDLCRYVPAGQEK